MQLNLYGKVEGGKLNLTNRESLNQWLKNLNEGEDIVVKFNVSKNYKSLRQLRLAYSLFRILSDKLGYTVTEVKMLMKIEQGLCAESTVEGKQISFCKSLSDFTKVEMSDFISRMDVWAYQKLGLKLLTNEDINFLEQCK